jgi:DNA polymerase-3 subunit alpha
LICIADGTLISDGARRQLSPEHRFKTRAEMIAVFADLPEAPRNSVEIALRCAYRPLTRQPILPRFTANGGIEEEAASDQHGAATGPRANGVDTRARMTAGEWGAFAMRKTSAGDPLGPRSSSN